MFLLNTHPDYGTPLDPRDADTFGIAAATEVERQLTFRDNHKPTPLMPLPGLAARLGVGAIHIKDEGQRLGLGSFKALGGAYAVIRLLLEQVSVTLGRHVMIAELHTPDVQIIARTLTVACATDGNHGRSVAQGAQLIGARSVIFVHSGVSDARVAAIARFGADIVRVDGSYDDSVREASRVAEAQGWTLVADTSWPGYERIPSLVMQGYTALVREALRQLPEAPTHVFIQAGVGGVAAAVAGHLALTLGANRPVFTVVDPARAACIVETARAGHPVTIAAGASTVMAMLECYAPSLVAWRVLARVADAFMTVDDDDAVAVMRQLAQPVAGDPALVAGESGGVGLAGLIKAVSNPAIKAALRIDERARIFLVNTEGATDPQAYEAMVGLPPAAVVAENTKGD